MKTIRPDLTTGNIFANALFILAAVVVLTVSCENDIATIKALNGELNMPSQTGSNVQITYTDSGQVKIELMAPELKRFSRENDPYYEFPKGLKVFFYQPDASVIFIR